MKKKDVLLTTQELADRWKLGTGHLRNLRNLGKSPPYIHVAAGAVRYRLKDIEAWETKHEERRRRR